MPGLTKPIIHWEIMNEPEFKMFFKGKEDEFVEIFNFSSKIIKEKQKDSIIVMAGAAGMFPENKKFWKSALPKIKDNFVILMAGGFGKRMRPQTNKTPKPMLEVNGRPILEQIIENLNNQLQEEEMCPTCGQQIGEKHEKTT